MRKKMAMIGVRRGEGGRGGEGRGGEGRGGEGRGGEGREGKGRREVISQVVPNDL